MCSTRYLAVVLICVSLMISDGESLFIRLLAKNALLKILYQKDSGSPNNAQIAPFPLGSACAGRHSILTWEDKQGCTPLTLNYITKNKSSRSQS